MLQLNKQVWAIERAHVKMGGAKGENKTPTSPADYTTGHTNS